ncbi:hypothetical protein GCM10027569_72390 [Flindersiella endophytica]
MASELAEHCKQGREFHAQAVITDQQGAPARVVKVSQVALNTDGDAGAPERLGNREGRATGQLARGTGLLEIVRQTVQSSAFALIVDMLRLRHD